MYMDEINELVLEPFLKQIKPLDIRPTNAIPEFKRDERIKAVIFDIYGTLIISASGDIMQDSYDAEMFYNALIQSGYNVEVPLEELITIHGFFEDQVKKGKEEAVNKGIPFPELNIVEIWKHTLNTALEQGLISESKKSNVKLFTFLFELNSNQVWPMPALSKTINEIKRRGYPIGIVSNAQFYTPVIMNYFLHNIIKDEGFIDGFEKDLSVFSYKLLRGKPDTYLYEQLLAPLSTRGLKPENVLFVGNDMLKDIYTASKTGFKTCFYAGDLRAYRLRKDHPEASKVKPDHIITELTQLLEIIKK